MRRHHQEHFLERTYLGIVYTHLIFVSNGCYPQATEVGFEPTMPVKAPVSKTGDSTNSSTLQYYLLTRVALCVVIWVYRTHFCTICVENYRLFRCHYLFTKSAHLRCTSRWVSTKLTFIHILIIILRKGQGSNLHTIETVPVFKTGEMPITLYPSMLPRYDSDVYSLVQSQVSCLLEDKVMLRKQVESNHQGCLHPCFSKAVSIANCNCFRVRLRGLEPLPPKGPVSKTGAAAITPQTHLTDW